MPQRQRGEWMCKFMHS